MNQNARNNDPSDLGLEDSSSSSRPLLQGFCCSRSTDAITAKSGTGKRLGQYQSLPSAVSISSERRRAGSSASLPSDGLVIMTPVRASREVDGHWTNYMFVSETTPSRKQVMGLP